MSPDPMTVRPTPHDRVVFLKPLIDSDKIVIGDYTYYDDPDDPTAFAERNVLYGYGPEKLVIGRYCALATGTRFIMAGANHPTMGVSTFPFTIFGGEWTERTIGVFADNPSRGDTVVGNDVWFGYQSVIMPGVRIGDGAIIASGSVVTSDVAPYTVVGGNPAKPIRKRFGDTEIEQLLDAAWWDWPADLVTRHAHIIMTGTPADIVRIAGEHRNS